MPSGGERKGAGRPVKYGEPTIRVPFYLPTSKKSHIVKVIKRYLKRYEK